MISIWCNDDRCPQRYECRRYSSVWTESMAAEESFRGLDGRCEMFLPLKKPQGGTRADGTTCRR